MIKSIDGMKLQKDVLRNQLTVPQIQQYISLLKTSFPGLTHIAVSVPINPDVDFVPYGITGVNQFEASWINQIHTQGLGVILRGVFCEAEGIWGFPINQSGAQYYLDKSSVYFDRVKAILNSNDIIAIFPESTNNAFNGKHFLGPVNPSSYVDFFAKLKALSLQKLPLNRFLVTNNFTELASGWASALPGIMGSVVVDDYQSTVAAQLADLNNLKAKYNKPIFVQEWADTGALGLNAAMADMFKNYPVDINFWVGWSGTNEAILNGGPGNFTLNDKGRALQPFFAGSPIPPPPPTPTPTPAPVDYQGMVEKIRTIVNV